VGGAWIFSEESFIKKRFNFLSFGKLRASYGTTGSDQIADYQFLSLYQSINNVSSPYQGVNGYQPVGLTNPYLQWEETRKLQIGIDLGFLKDRILLNANYSHNRSSNQLISYGLPVTTGFYSIASNLPATVQNTGWEFSLSTINTENKKIKWSTSVNLTIPKNKLIGFENFENSGYASNYIIGQSINILKLYHFSGVNSSTGTYQFLDHNGNLTLNPVPNGNPDNDAISVVNQDPKFYGGVQNSFTYKGFQLDILFQLTKQLGQNYFLGNGSPVGSPNNQSVSFINRWQEPNDIATYEKYTTNTTQSFSNALNSDAIWSDASYIRLKNLSLSWQLPQTWRKSAHIRDCSLFVQGQNLLTITNYIGLDPETKSSVSLPTLRIVTLGVKMGL